MVSDGERWWCRSELDARHSQHPGTAAGRVHHSSTKPLKASRLVIYYSSGTLRFYGQGKQEIRLSNRGIGARDTKLRRSKSTQMYVTSVQVMLDAEGFFAWRYECYGEMSTILKFLSVQSIKLVVGN